MFLNEIKLVRQIKFVCSKLYAPVFNYLYKANNNRKNKSKKTRILFCSGNISLVNILTILNEKQNDNFDNILVVDTGKGRKQFIDTNKQLIKLYPFKKVIFLVNIRLETEIVLKNLYKADEIYVLNHPMHIEMIKELYPQTPITFIDEGPSSLISYDTEIFKNGITFKTHKYLDKLDFCGAENIGMVNLEPLNIGEFRKISQKIVEESPIKIPFNKDDKVILFCGIYWEVTGLSKEEYTKLQNEMLNDLLNAGYKILYKPHPRETEIYDLADNSKIKFISTKLPVELYNWDVVAAVTVSSTISVSLPHYWDIPCFSNVLDKTLAYDKSDIVKIALIRNMVKEYSPNYKELLNFDVHNTPKEILKEKIKVVYNNFINEKCLLSQNDNINAHVRRLNEKQE